MKKTIISSFFCLVIGICIGIGSYYFIQKKQSDKLQNDISIEVIGGEKNVIEHTKVVNKPKHIELTTESHGKGKVITKIKKENFCPKELKNSLSLIVYAGIHDLQPTLSYGVEYRRQLLRRVYILTGLKVDTVPIPTYQVNGCQVFIGAGFNF